MVFPTVSWLRGQTTTAPATFPPAAHQARVPTCVVRFYARPQHRTFREDSAGVPQ